MTKRRKWIIGTIVGVVVVAVAALAIVLTQGPHGQPVPPAAPSQPSPSAGPVFAAKIDNVAEARPQTGLSSADVVYVEPVEGGLTRLLAVYFGSRPDVLGPVRSARSSDIGVLAQYGQPVLAYSGAAPEILPALRSASLVNASPAEVPGAYFRDNGRPAPHNLYVHPAGLPGGTPPPADSVPRFGPVPTAGTPVSAYQVRYPAASYDFRWSPDSHRWAIFADGAPLSTTEAGRLDAATVIEQRVDVRVGEPGESGAVANSPVAQTVGSGEATILRDGQRFAATWNRPAPQSPTRFLTTTGDPLPLAQGPVWILLTAKS
ncbi:DUF3048 domain-containing protein [Amycolatopsis pigmentata]|uniref:DUF3048 domain-containing protein n=1 Tax=Amycolatopsis pigmentata TaxID=450801 RepID=A0ABW5G628_9PSEU